jgi:hypothetical protein
MGAVFEKFNIPLSEYQIDQLFKRCDSDNTGMLKKNHLVEIAR